MKVQCRILTVPAAFLMVGGMLAGCPLRDARLEDLVEIPCFADVDCDDGNPCTQGVCNTATSYCVISALDGVAPSQAKPGNCVERVCQNGTEVIVPMQNGIPIAQQTAGDCRKVVCDGAGNHSTVDDLADVLDDGNDCTLDVCEGGIAKNSVAAMGTPCGPSGKLQCNASGQCAGCTNDSECSNGGNFCVIAVCDSNKTCATIPKSAGTALPLEAQVPQDCRRQICDGTGHLVEAFDSKDGQDDGNDCTDDLCNGGMPMYPPTAAGVACGGGDKVCDGGGNCRAKTSTPCSKSLECASGYCVDGVCCDSSCLATCMACNVNGFAGTCTGVPFPTPDPMCFANKVCDGSGVCKLVNGRPCGSNDSYCASNTCSGGVCKSAIGQPCAANADCVTAMCVNNVCEL